MKRWIIRSFFIGLLLLCVGGWAAFQGERAWQIRYTNGQTFLVSGFDGHIQVTWIGQQYFDSNGWFFERDGETSPGTYAYPVKGIYYPQFWGPLHGFRYDLSYREFLGCSTSYTDDAKRIGVPFWLPTTLTAGLLWLVWRRTRPTTLDPKTAFPVDAKQSA